MLSKVFAECPNCRNKLDIFNKNVSCDFCGTKYPAPFNVPILIPDVKIENTTCVDLERMNSIVAALGAEHCREQIEECFSINIKIPNSSLQIESDQFLQRLRSGGAEIDLENQRSSDKLAAKNTPTDVKLRINPLILPLYFPAGKYLSINAKIENIGKCIVSSNHEMPLNISYRWRQITKKSIFNYFTKSDRLIDRESLRTKLLVDVYPGKKVTQAIKIQCPNSPGEYILEIMPVIEGVSWLTQNTLALHTKVYEKSPPISFSQNLDGPPLTYSQQHINASNLFMKWVKNNSGKDIPCILEIGGNFHPSTQGLPLEQVINLDVDAHGLMARSILKNDSIKSIVADGMDIPFADKTFDFIVMFATFHHFWEPIKFLEKLAEKIKPSGLICLMCEPIGHVFAEHNYKEFIEELERGVNEQSFEIWEYLQMIDEAGLKVEDALFDRGSAMIAATPK